MSRATGELIMAEIAALPSDEREKLWVTLNWRAVSIRGASDKANHRRKISRTEDKLQAHDGIGPKYVFVAETTLPSLSKTTVP
jgi:hypothetical protein